MSSRSAAGGLATAGRTGAAGFREVVLLVAGGFLAAGLGAVAARGLRASLRVSSMCISFKRAVDPCRDVLTSPRRHYDTRYAECRFLRHSLIGARHLRVNASVEPARP